MPLLLLLPLVSRLLYLLSHPPPPPPSPPLPSPLPSSLPPDANFSLVAGDFEEIYGADDAEGDGSGGGMHAGPWDAVLTCFFIDTVRACLPGKVPQS